MSLGLVATFDFTIAEEREIEREEKKNQEYYTLNRIETIESHKDIINNEMIEKKQPGLLKDLMRDLPGVSIGGSTATAQRIQIRGVNQDGLNVTIDGARQRGIVFHHNSNLLIDPDVLKQVDINVGTNSIIANSGSLGGAVAFTTVDASDMLKDGQNFGFKAKTGYASNNNEWQKSLMLYGKAWEMLDMLVFLNHRSHDFGHSAKSDGSTWPGSIGLSKDKQPTKGIEYEIGGQGEVINSLVKATLNISPKQKLSFSYEHLEYDGRYPWRGEFGAYAYDIIGQPRYPTSASRDTYSLIYHLELDNFALDSNAYINNVRYKLDLDVHTLENVTVASRGAPVWDLNTLSAGWKTMAKNTFKTGFLTHSILYGYEWYSTFQHVKNKDSIKSSTPNSVTVQPSSSGLISIKNLEATFGAYLPDDIATNISGFAEYTLGLDTRIGNFNLTPGVRYDYYMLRSNRHDNIYNNVSGGVGLSYKAPFGLGVFANWTQLFKGPDVLEGIFLQGDLAGNQKLKPETGENYEVGINYHKSFGDNYSVGFVGKYFNSHYDNLIAYLGGRGGQSRYRQNVSDISLDGVELALRGAIYDLGISLSYTGYIRNDIRNFQNTTPYSLIPYVGDKYTINLEYFLQPIELLIGWNSMFYTAYGKKGDLQYKPAFNVHDLYLSWVPERMLEGFNMTLGFYNITNEFYSNPNNKNNDVEPGFNTRISVSYKY